MNRIKVMLLGVALSGAALSASAASTYLFDNPENKTYFGARVGVDISSAANGGGFYSNSPGFSLGAVYNIPVFMNLYFEPGLGIFYNTIGANQWTSFTQEVTNPSTGVVEDVEVPYQIDGSIRNFGFRIPLLIGYHFDFTEDIKVNVFTGPQLNLSLVSLIIRTRSRYPATSRLHQAHRCSAPTVSSMPTFSGNSASAFPIRNIISTSAEHGA